MSTSIWRGGADRFSVVGELLVDLPAHLDSGGTALIYAEGLGVLELIAFAEEGYGVEVEDDEVVPDNFDGVRRLANYIRSKQRVAVAA